MKYDLAIIGAGPGGYSAALRACKLGARVAVIEENELGGTCLNLGCIPTKTLLKSAVVYREIKKADIYGIEVEGFRPDLNKIMERKNKVVNALRSGMNAQMKANGIQVIKGRAKVAGVHKICVDSMILEAENIIVAAGSYPAKPSIDGIDDNSVIFSDQALSLNPIPASIIVIGGGVIGLEFAFLFSELGAKVSIIEMRESILPGFDQEISNEMTKILTRTGIEIITSASVKSIQNGEVAFQKQEEVLKRIGDKVLVSVGRRANTQGLFSEELNIDMNNGFIAVDENMRTSIKNIFAIGDVNGKGMLAHTASAEGITAVENALGTKSEMHYDAVPKCVYTFPEIAVVGLTEKEAKAEGIGIKHKKYPLRANGRALADGNIEGFIKMVKNEATNQIIGIHIIAPYAAEMISAGTMAVKNKMTDSELGRMIFPHPAVSEILGEAANDLWYN